MYFNYKKNYNKLLNQDYIEPIIIYRSFVFIFILYKLYIISIIILYYKKEFDENSWQYIPLHVLFFIYLFISYPSIIYLLYKINERNIIMIKFLENYKKIVNIKNLEVYKKFYNENKNIMESVNIELFLKIDEKIKNNYIEYNLFNEFSNIIETNLLINIYEKEL